MTNSIDGFDSEEEKQRELQKLKENYESVPATERDDLEDIPRYMKLACVKHDLLGHTWKSVAEDVERSPSTLDKWKRSPAVQEFREGIKEFSEDPVEMSKAMLRGQSLGVTADYLVAFEQAMEQGDYKEVGKMARDLLDRMGITKKRDPSEQAQQVIINMPEGAEVGDRTVVESDYEVVDDDD